MRQRAEAGEASLGTVLATTSTSTQMTTPPEHTAEQQ